MASQQQTYTTDMTVTAAMLNSEFGELYSNLSNSNISASAAIALSKLASDAWTTYTPTWTATSVNPAIGNGTLVGRYTKVGRLYHFLINLTAGSTTTFGTGNWAFALPTTTAAFRYDVAVGYCSDSSAVQDFALNGFIGVSGTTMGPAVGAADGSFLRLDSITSAIPFTWADGDVLRMGGWFESAS